MRGGFFLTFRLYLELNPYDKKARISLIRFNRKMSDMALFFYIDV